MEKCHRYDRGRTIPDFSGSKGEAMGTLQADVLWSRLPVDGNHYHRYRQHPDESRAAIIGIGNFSQAPPEASSPAPEKRPVVDVEKGACLPEVEE